MFKINLTKGQFVIVDEDIYNKYYQLKWHVKFTKGNYYARRNYNEYLHHLVMGRKPMKNEEAKFINGNSLDCRRSNLRFVPKRLKTSNYRGVVKICRASIEYKGEVFRKDFSNEEEAALWYNEKAKEFFGAKAKLNKISPFVTCH